MEKDLEIGFQLKTVFQGRDLAAKKLKDIFASKAQPDEANSLLVRRLPHYASASFAII